MKYRTDLILGEAFCIFIFFYFLDSGLSVLNGLQFYFWLRDSENPKYRKSRIWEMKKDKDTKSLAKNQACAIFQMQHIQKNILPKVIKLCMEAPCWCPFEGHKYGQQKPTETSVF